MPTYEYECLKCGKRFELFQAITEEPRKRCPHCRGKVRRLVGAGAGMIFKGSGFYTTDYRSESYKSEKKKESGETPKPETPKPEAPKPETPKPKHDGKPKPAPKSEGAGRKGKPV